MGPIDSALNKPDHLLDMLAILGCFLKRHFGLKFRKQHRQLCLVENRITGSIHEPKTYRFS